MFYLISTDSPSKLYKVGNGQKVAVAGENATALLHILDNVHDCTSGTKLQNAKLLDDVFLQHTGQELPGFLHV